MPLSHDIVIKNQFSIRLPSGVGTRGRTPGAYVERYMARRDASEVLGPARVRDVDPYVRRYMLRDEAVESADAPRDVAPRLQAAEGTPRAGVAFCEGDVSMSSEAVRARSSEIQDAFDHGKTVLKTVISFDSDYLARNGVCDEGFRPQSRGDWRGHVDQLRLRRAVQRGMERMGASFDDLRWIGVIQVDTMHVHAHIAAVDMGRGRVREDGTQSGTITGSMKEALRRGIDMELEDMGQIRTLSAEAGHDRQEARSVVKEYTHAAMERGGMGQFLIACLPDDRRRWRAGSHARDMRKANAVCEFWVRSVLDAEGEAWARSRQAVLDYASGRKVREGLSDAEFSRLVRQGEDRLVETCMNGVYQVLRDVPRSEISTETATLDVMSMDLSSMVSLDRTDPSVEFASRLCGYSARLDHHRAARQRFHDLAEDWAERRRANPSMEVSRPLYELFREEEAYNTSLMCKYQHFLAFVPPHDAYERDVALTEAQARSLADMEALANDGRIRDMEPDLAESFGRRVHRQRGGRIASKAPDLYRQRVDAAREAFERQLADLRFRLAAEGLVADEVPAPEDGLGRDEDEEDGYERPRGVVTLDVHPGQLERFEDVKALDIHHLALDFPFGCDIARGNVDAFVDAERRREAALFAAESYLVSTGQSMPEVDEVSRDVESMRQKAADLGASSSMGPVRTEGVELRRTRTTSLDVDVTDDVRSAIVRSLEDADRALAEDAGRSEGPTWDGTPGA